MSIVYTGPEGTVIIPGAYSRQEVVDSTPGIPAAGVVAVVGESSSGQDVNSVGDTEDLAFSPRDISEVVAQFGRGPLVDAFNFVANPSLDARIPGAPTKIYCFKTNKSLKAKGNLPKVGGGVYAQLADKKFGKSGNLISYQVVAAETEKVPSTGLFSYIPAVGTAALAFRVNGGASIPQILAANTSPSAFVLAVDALAGIAATGGVNRNILSVAGSLSLDANPALAGANVVDILWTQPLLGAPAVGDTLIIPAASIIAGPGDANVGSYMVIQVSGNTIRGLKISDAGRVGAVVGTVTAPVDVAAALVVSVTEMSCFSPVAISLEAGPVISGVGKSLEISDLQTGTQLVSDLFLQLGVVTPVSFISLSGNAKLIESVSEYKAKLDLIENESQISQSVSVGGDVVLALSYQGTSATVTVSDLVLSTNVVGGPGVSLSLNLADYPTFRSLVLFLNSQAGYKAELPNLGYSQFSSKLLDDVSGVGIASQFGALNGRLKADGYFFAKKVTEETSLVQVGDPILQAVAGLPDVMPLPLFLAGGTLGGTSNAEIVSAIKKLEGVEIDFIVSAFSSDASVDVPKGITDPSSSYSIDSINQLMAAHVLKLSNFFNKKERQAFLSKKGTFKEARQAAQKLGLGRVSVSFQESVALGPDGNSKNFPPYAIAAVAAGMQAAGQYKAIVYKRPNLSGVFSESLSFDLNNQDDVAQALEAGLLVISRRQNGGLFFVSDQTSFGSLGNNFVFNSIQAQFSLDRIAKAVRNDLEARFTGESNADVSVPAAALALQSLMEGFLALKLIAPSSDAPNGYKNVLIRINGPVIEVQFEVKLATAVLFSIITAKASLVKNSN